MLDYFRRILTEAGKHSSGAWHEKMFASFHDPSGKIHVYIDIPDNWPRIVKLGYHDVIRSRESDFELVIILRKLKKDIVK